MKFDFAIITICAAGLLLGGCGLNLSFLSPATTKKVSDANKNKDWAYLQKVCSGEQKTDSGDPHIKRAACRYLEHRAGTAAFDGATCKTLVATFKKARGGGEKFVVAAGERFIKCGLWTEFFETVVRRGKIKDNPRALQALTEKGHPVHAKFVEYAKTHKGKKFMPVKTHYDAEQAVGGIANFLIRAGHTDTATCEAVAKAALGALEGSQVWTFDYLEKANCPSALPVVGQLLLSSKAQYRIWACDALATIGTAKSLRKLKTLADTDNYYEVVEEVRGGRVWAVKVFGVRDRCRKAHGQLTLRLD